MTDIIKIKDLNLHFPIYGQRKFLKRQAIDKLGGKINQVGKNFNVHALKNINLTIQKGEKIGFIGHNGAGKSTLLSTIYGIYKPDSGSLIIDGKASAIFNPVSAMDGELDGITNIYRLALLLGDKKSDTKKKLEKIISDSNLENFIYLPIRTYSTGMRLRLGFSVIINSIKDIILIDEMITVGDSQFKNYAYEKIEEACSKNATLIIATHSKNILLRFTNKLVVMEKGSIIEIGNTEEMINKYKI